MTSSLVSNWRVLATPILNRYLAALVLLLMRLVAILCDSSSRELEIRLLSVMFRFAAAYTHSRALDS